MVKKKSIKIILSCLTCIFFSTVAYSQNVILKGSVIDSLTSEPLAMSIVSLVTEDGQTELFSGLVHNLDGSFEFKNVDTKGKKCVVKVRFMGYKDKLIPHDQTLGVIRLAQNPVSSEEVTVIGRTAIRRTVDRTSYIADSLDLSKISVTTDILRQIPELSVDELLRKVSIKGKENTLVMQNGINTGTSVDIRTIDFRNIERIDVITSPSSGTESEYDGVVNIIMKQKVPSGFTIDLEETMMINLHSNDTYLGLAWNKDNVAVKLTYSNYFRAHPFESTKSRYGNNESFTQEGYSPNPFEMTNDIGFNVDYHISPNDFLNLTTSSKLVGADKSIAYLTSDLNDFTSRSNSDYFIGNYTLYYRHTMKNKRTDYLSVNANLGYMNAREGSSSIYQSGAKYLNDETADKFSSNLRVEYNNQLSSKFKLNTGAQFLYQKFHSVLNSTSSDNNYRNLRGVMYADFYATVRKWQFKVGVKGELNVNNFDNTAYPTTTQFLFQPTASILYNINKKHSLSIEYRRPSSYPSSWMLSPFVIQLDQKSTQIGNPELRLTSYDVVEFNYTYRSDMVTLKVAPFYQYSSNIIIPQTIFDKSFNSITKFVNGGYKHRAGMLFSGSLNFLQGAISIEPDMYVGYDNTIAPNLTQHNLSYRLGCAVNLYLPLGFGIGAYGAYRNKSLTINGYTEPQYTLDAIYILKRFEKIGLNLFAGYQDLVKSADVDYIISDNYTERNFFKFDSKGFILRLNYYFSTKKSKRMEHIDTYFNSERK